MYAALAEDVTSDETPGVPLGGNLDLYYMSQRFGQFVAAAALLASACAGSDSAHPGIQLRMPEGFEAEVLVDSLGPARHLAINENGDIYVKLRRTEEEGSIVALRDSTGDGKIDVIERFGVYSETDGVYQTEARIHDGHLYVSTDLHVYRYRLTPGHLVPRGPPDTLVVDDHAHGRHEHITKPIAFDDEGNLYVPFGAPNNACQEPKRTPGVPGLDPCPDLEDHGGIWVFDKNRSNQTQREGRLFASGLRSIVGMDWNPADRSLYAVMHGRDDVHRLWPNLYSEWDNAMLPAEEFNRITDGSDFGWPYCYYDQMQGRRVLAPEYGGDGERLGRCGAFQEPLIGFPGHFAPNDLMFYRGEQFPDRYRNGAFIAFHGSTIRNPYPQAGYMVAFVPFLDDEPGEWELFANGFAGADPVVNTSDALHRPVGLATGPDGALYVSDSRKGTIWRIRFTGDRDAFGPAQLAGMEEEKQIARNVRTPDPVEDNLLKGQVTATETIYNTYCAPCHQQDGEGSPPRYPPLAGSEWVTGDPQRLISVILNGLEGPIDVRGERYDNPMPQHRFLSDADVARVATYIRTNFGNEAGPVTADEVASVRAASTE